MATSDTVAMNFCNAGKKGAIQFRQLLRSSKE
jgi:hypothetical protein